MTISDFKKNLYAVIDEQKPKSDITSKMATFINMGQREIALYYPIYKEKQYSLSEGEGAALPEDCYKPVRCYNENGVAIRFKATNNNIFSGLKNFKLLYEASPKELPQDAQDSYELQTQGEAIQALIYFVAAQLYNNEDGMGVFQSYYAQYQGKMQNLAMQPRLASAVAYEEEGNV